MHDDAPLLALYEPAAQATHVVLSIAPITALDVPAGHSVGFNEEKGQYEPDGQIIGVPVLQ